MVSSLSVPSTIGAFRGPPGPRNDKTPASRRGSLRFSVALLAYLRDPPFSRRVIRPRRPSSPIRSERRRASADTSTVPASFSGRCARRPSVVTTMATRWRSWPLSRPKSVSVSSRRPHRGRRCSRSLPAFVDSATTPTAPGRTGPGRAVCDAGRTSPPGATGAPCRRPCCTAGRAGAYYAEPVRGSPVRRASPGAWPQSFFAGRRDPRAHGRRAAPRRSALRSSRWPRGVLVGRRQEFAAVPKRRPEGVQSSLHPRSVPAHPGTRPAAAR